MYAASRNWDVRILVYRPDDEPLVYNTKGSKGTWHLYYTPAGEKVEAHSEAVVLNEQNKAKKEGDVGKEGPT